MGTACTPAPDGGADSCGGFCLAVGASMVATAHFCSRPCVLGVPNACDIADGTMSLASGAHGGCVLANTGADLGDIGFCTQECDTVGDCLDKRDSTGMCDTTITTGTNVAPHGFCTF